MGYGLSSTCMSVEIGIVKIILGKLLIIIAQLKGGH
jgi:hypothetical protein